MIFFTPHSFFFFILYILFNFLLFFINSFFIFWFIIELATLTFVGFGYSVFKNIFSYLILFFILQSVSSIGIFIGFYTTLSFILSFFFLIKLSMFPFFFWFPALIVFFPNISLFTALTVFKIPPFLMIYTFSAAFSNIIIICSSVLTLIVGGIYIYFSNDLRFILISSSVANNSWFYLSTLRSLATFTVFWLFYSSFLFLFFVFIGTNYKQSFSFFDRLVFLLYILLILLSGFPPSPLFFIKVYIISTICLVSGFSFLIVFILSSFLVILSYLSFFLKTGLKAKSLNLNLNI